MLLGLALGATDCSKVLLRPRSAATARSKIQHKPASGPTGHSEKLLVLASGPTDCSKMPLWPPSGPERSKILLWHASAPPEHSKLLIGPASGPQSAMKCHSGRHHRDNIRRNRSKTLFKKPGSVTLHSAALLSASLSSCFGSVYFQIYCSKVLGPVTLCSVSLALLHFATCMECTGSH